MAKPQSTATTLATSHRWGMPHITYSCNHKAPAIATVPGVLSNSIVPSLLSDSLSKHAVQFLLQTGINRSIEQWMCEGIAYYDDVCDNGTTLAADIGIARRQNGLDQFCFSWAIIDVQSDPSMNSVVSPPLLLTWGSISCSSAALGRRSGLYSQHLLMIEK